ncbi:MAG: acetylserotonin O-methyltransferase [Actinobacteria bacterium]|nr:acetylserotonin O-methyltransferase [Actinomycetota bacterium]
MESGAQQEVPVPAAMMGLITGYWVSQAVGVVARLGVADELAAGPRDSNDLARAVGADPQALYRVLRLLASLGVFTEVPPGSFSLTPLGDTLRSNSPDSVRNFAITETAPGHWLPWGRLYESVRTGQPMAREALGMDLFEWYSKNPEEADHFSAAMGNLAALAASELVRVCDFSSVRTVADIGGAHGVLLTAVLQANPAARGILFDLPHVIATAGAAIASGELSDRCELMSGDFFEAVPEGADLHLLKQVVHDWDDERATRLLQNCHRALTPAGKVVLVEMVIPSDNRPSPAQAMDLNMLVLLGGQERTEEHFERLLGAAGFRLERIIPTHSPFSVIEATRV